MGLVCQASPEILHPVAASPPPHSAACPAEAEQQEFDRRTRGYAAQCAAAWAKANAASPGFGATVCPAEKLEREHRADRYLDELESDAAPVSRISGKARGLVPGFAACLAPVRRGLPGRRLRKDWIDCSLPKAWKRPAISFGRPGRLTQQYLTRVSSRRCATFGSFTASSCSCEPRLLLSPAIFAYSMLYPWTDNCLDDPRLAPAAKIAFGDWLALRLTGEEVAPPRPSFRASLPSSQHDRAALPKVGIP